MSFAELHSAILCQLVGNAPGRSHARGVGIGLLETKEFIDPDGILLDRRIAGDVWIL